MTGTDNWVGVWSIVENSRRRFWVGSKPGKAWGLAGRFMKLYNPDTGTTSRHYSYQAERYAQQPDSRWLYDHTPA